MGSSSQQPGRHSKDLSRCEAAKHQEAKENTKSAPKVSFLRAFLSGSTSSALTTVLFQPLELLKTRIQILSNTKQRKHPSLNKPPLAYGGPIFGRSTRSVIQLVRQHNILYLWRGTGASLLRSVPGVGLYYSSLNLMENFSGNASHESSVKSFSSGCIARSFVSFVLLPVTVIKVRYESGNYLYKSILSATRDSYLKSGWVGLTPTIIRDSLFSGVYYALYTNFKHKLGSYYQDYYTGNNGERSGKDTQTQPSLVCFISGILSGSLASLVTNPADVLKTNMQAEPEIYRTMADTARIIYVQRNGLVGFFDGLGPRMLRRTLVAALTWTIYECVVALNVSSLRPG